MSTEFKDYGDLVEVTFDNGDIELLTKDEAIKIGYKERLKVQVVYKGKIYDSVQFSKLTGVSKDSVIKYYSRGITDGEEIIALYNKNREACKQTQITYKGKVYNGAQFSELAEIDKAAVNRYYSKGITDGEKIIEEYRRHAETRSRVQIKYKGQVYSANQFAELIGSYSTMVIAYYDAGITDGEEIEAEINKRRAEHFIGITYNGKTYNKRQFSKQTGISLPFIDKCIKNGMKSGEEIVEAHSKSKSPKCKITYKGKGISTVEFSQITGIKEGTIIYYYRNGITTGEEIIDKLKERRNIRIMYNGKEYSNAEFSSLTGLHQDYIGDKYKSGIVDGEEILKAYNEYKETHREIQIHYQGAVYNSSAFAKLINVKASTIVKYYNKGITDGEEIVALYNKNRKREVAQISYKGKTYRVAQFSKLTGISKGFVHKRYKLGLTTGEAILEAYSKRRNK